MFASLEDSLLREEQYSLKFDDHIKLKYKRASKKHSHFESIKFHKFHFEHSFYLNLITVYLYGCFAEEL